METIYIHEGIAYLSKDLALINGADELSLYTLKLNETQSEDINIIVSLNEVTFEDDYQNELSFPTTGGLEYMRIENGFTGLTKKLSNRIDSEIINFVDGFDEEDYFNED